MSRVMEIVLPTAVVIIGSLFVIGAAFEGDWCDKWYYSPDFKPPTARYLTPKYLTRFEYRCYVLRHHAINPPHRQIES